MGDFTLEASLDLSNELKPGDPVMVNLQIAGKGNLDTLAAPRLDAPDSHWKTYPPSRTEKEGSRRSNQGVVEFTQILRPLVAIKEVPPFTLSFFNPKTAAYEVLTSSPIPLNLSPLTSESSGIPQAGLVPVAEMKDILGLIEPKPFTPASTFRIGLWWQILPAIVVALLGFLLIKRQLPRLKKDESRKQEIQNDLQELTKNKEAHAFLRAANNLADRHEVKEDEFIQGLREERDQRCFQPDEADSELSSSRRKEILTGLRERLTQLALIAATLFIFLPHSAEAGPDKAQAAWSEGNYQEALDAYQLLVKEKATPDLLYNMGDCYYRLNQPGKAALYFRRALKLDPEHPEALQNLAFIENKMGAISDPLSNAPTWLKQMGVTRDKINPAWTRKLTLPILRNLFLAAIWLSVIALLLRLVFTSRASRKLSQLGLIAFPTLALIFGIIYLYHPGDPLAEASDADAVITASKDAPVRTEASSGGSEILIAKPSTPCLVRTVRGDWTYIELLNFERTRGWIQSSSLEKI